MKKKCLLVLTILLLMVSSLLGFMSQSYAYWQAGIGNADTMATGTITTGAWNQPFEWDPNVTYEAGDLVINNGVIYEAKRNNPTREPGGEPGWQRDWDAA